ncbi:hypothetical protein MRB53_017664 [Persea americana]|uniref:Uncharacterized protein n=1 Tax=Persea americana TaxID=3435 RepID=A0ACC2M5N7_PERAE|nr:hypothetical protein MRB53_017664 [Persea americana]
MERWLLNDLIQQYQLGEPHLPHQSRTSSSSSSFRSLSIESPEYPSLLLNMVGSSPSRVPNPIQEAPTHQQHTIQAQNQLRSFEEVAMTRAMLAVISSPASSSSSSYDHSQIPTSQRQPGTRRTAFKAYGSAPGPLFRRRNGLCGQSKIKRLFAFLRMVGTQMQEQVRPTGNQLHHMISERRRREKLNESFRALKGLLPPGSKTDKASVLSNTREYLHVLKAQVLDLQKKNQALKTSLLPEKEDSKDVYSGDGETSGRAVVEVVGVSESSSGDRRIEVRVIAREEECDMIDLLIGLLEYLRQMQDVSLEFVDADTQLHQISPVNQAILTLKIKRSEWNQESFKEAVTKAVCDVAQGRKSIS